MCTLGPAEYTDGQVREFVQVNGLDASYLGQGIVGGQILKLGTRDSIGLYNSCVDDFTSEQFSGYSTGANTFNGIVYIVGPDYIYRFNVTNVPLIQTI